MKKLTTLQLSASDQDSEPAELFFRITKQPSLGHLEHSTNPGRIREQHKISDTSTITETTIKCLLMVGGALNKHLYRITELVMLLKVTATM